MMSLTCGIYNIQQTSEHNKEEADPQIERKMRVISGERGAWRGIIGLGE